MIDFKEISYQYLSQIITEHKLSIKLRHPFRCFSIIKENQEVGLMCIGEKDKETAESSLYIFKNFKFKVLFKNNLIKIINFPFNLGYKKVIASTKIRSLARLLECFSFEGVQLLENFFEDDSDKEKFWFCKVKGGV